MGSAQRTALTLGIVLMLSGAVAVADDAAAGPIAMPVAQSAPVLPGADAETVNPEDTAPRHQTLSTLGALALGIIGLLWVRRHTAEL